MRGCLPGTIFDPGYPNVFLRLAYGLIIAFFLEKGKLLHQFLNIIRFGLNFSRAGSVKNLTER